MLRLANETYRAHRVAAAPGTHAKMVELVRRHAAPDARIVDLGAFTGALLARVRDAGFSRLAAADLANHLTESVASFRACDFNTPFATAFAGEQFDCVTACEVIEHLDDPRAFLRECRRLLRPGGVVVISTPNIGFFEGRIKFALTGELWGFSARSYRSQRNISPIPARHVPMMLKEAGFARAEVITAASFATTLRRVLTAPIWLPMRALLGRQVLGETLLFVGVAGEESGEAAIEGQAVWRAEGA
jgi:2-polyprenyl-3-methyl-5-hydroxy-6-metoxy-1,4-benzoquinol methylase